MDTQEFKSKTEEVAKVLDDAGLRFAMVITNDGVMQILNNIDKPELFHMEAICQLAIQKAIEDGRVVEPS